MKLKRVHSLNQTNSADKKDKVASLNFLVLAITGY
ncbi:MAG: hypothetical protein ACJA2Q_002094 [Pseudohongiellaceae bacterium]|jgi:hypothetical protein